MKSIRTPLILAGIAAAAYIFYRNFKNFSQTYTATLGKIRFNKAETQRNAFLKAVFNVDLLVNNPSNLSGSIQAVKLNITMNNKLLATVNQTMKISLPANNQTLVPINVGISTLNIFGNITEAIQSITNKRPLQFEISGAVLTNYGTINIQEIANVTF